MANVAKYKEVRAWGADEEVLEIVYDFSVDGGAIGALNLFKAKEGLVVTKAYVVAEAAVTSADAATIALGIVGGTGAEFMAATAKTSFSLGAGVPGVANLAKALAADAVVAMTIADFALTAGKLRIRFHLAGQA